MAKLGGMGGYDDEGWVAILMSDGWLSRWLC